MPVLTADALEETHPYLPGGWQRSMQRIQRDGGPWPCGACDSPSYLCYRCSSCGHDLAGDGSTAGRQGVNK